MSTESGIVCECQAQMSKCCVMLEAQYDNPLLMSVLDKDVHDTHVGVIAYPVCNMGPTGTCVQPTCLALSPFHHPAVFYVHGNLRDFPPRAH